MTELQSLPQMSASQIKTAKVCLRKYWEQYIKYNRDMSGNVYAATGTAAHEALQHYLTTNDSKLEPRIKIKVASTIDKWKQQKKEIMFLSKAEQATKAVIDMLDAQGLQQIDSFLGDEQVVDTELYFQLPFPSVNPICRMTGYIDLVTNNWVVDWKTSSKSATKAELTHDPQFIIYYWAFLQLYKKPPEKVIRYKLSEHFPQDFSLDDINTKFNELYRDVLFVLHMREQLGTIVPIRKELDSTCRSCSFFQNCYNESLYRVR